jgi:hypothetical protein
MQRNDDDTITPVPFAEMLSGNPFELYEDRLSSDRELDALLG